MKKIMTFCPKNNKIQGILKLTDNKMDFSIKNLDENVHLVFFGKEIYRKYDEIFDKKIIFDDFTFFDNNMHIVLLDEKNSQLGYFGKKPNDFDIYYLTKRIESNSTSQQQEQKQSNPNSEKVSDSQNSGTTGILKSSQNGNLSNKNSSLENANLSIANSSSHSQRADNSNLHGKEAGNLSNKNSSLENANLSIANSSSHSQRADNLSNTDSSSPTEKAIKQEKIFSDKQLLDSCFEIENYLKQRQVETVIEPYSEELTKIVADISYESAVDSEGDLELSKAENLTENASDEVSSEVKRADEEYAQQAMENGFFGEKVIESYNPTEFDPTDYNYYEKDPLIFEDSTITDDLEIADRNYYEEESQTNAQLLEKLFERYERFEPMENIIQNSKFVKIDFDEQKYYIVGGVYEGGKLEYIVYGLPTTDNEYSRRLTEIAHLYPISNNLSFYLLFQDDKGMLKS